MSKVLDTFDGAKLRLGAPLSVDTERVRILVQESRRVDILKLQKKSKDVSLRGKVLPTASRACLMGILNVTPDSFTGGAEYMDRDTAIKRAKWMEASGADIIDIGGESSRPGASPVSAEEELLRIMPVIDKVAREVNIPVSVDTYKSEVARRVLKKGVSIINDITALNGDPAMAEVVAKYGAGIVLMHMKGKPETMQSDTRYGDVIEEILSYLSEAVRKAEKAGISPDSIIVDPGIGFGKTVEQNLAILRDLGKFRSLGKPVLVGTSRKAFIGALTGKEVNDRVFGTASSVAAAILNGADIVRVHDVAEMRDVVLVADAIKRE